MPPVYGKKYGLTIGRTWCKLFEANEEREGRERWTDDQLAAFMAEEFPNRNSKLLKNVYEVRSKFNRGGFKEVYPGTKGKPPCQSHRYNSRGDVIVTKKNLKTKDMRIPIPITGRKKTLD